MLLRTQQNALAQRIVQQGLDPAEFAPFENLKATDGTSVTRLRHISSDYYIDFFEGHGTEISPGSQAVAEIVSGRDFGLQFLSFCNWLDYLKREIEAPDLWAELRKQKDLVQLTRSESTDNSAFTEPERSRIEKGIEEIRLAGLILGGWWGFAVGLILSAAGSFVGLYAFVRVRIERGG